jgi:hypothetical protein
MIDFPNNPTVGQTFTAAGVTWTWDGTKWTSNGLNVPYLPLAGGTMSGPITLQSDPVAPLQPATKQYVDFIEASYSLGSNRIINGDMRWDQRNNGAASTVNNIYTADRWQYGGSQAAKGTWQRVSSAAPGFGYALSFISSSAYASVAADVFWFLQPIEADQITDFQWGSASAQPVTLSFLVWSSLSGTFSGALQNYAQTRSYPFTYSIPVASTWTKIVITIPGDTGGTWVMSGNAGSAYLAFDLGSGSTHRGPANAWASANYYGATGSVSIVAVNGAQFLVTGVKLEIGSVATPFNRQSLAKSLADCQRYYSGTLQIYGAGSGQVAGQPFIHGSLSPIWMRAAPTTVNLTTANSSNWTLVSVTSNNSSITANGNATAAGLVILNVLFNLSAEL